MFYQQIWKITLTLSIIEKHKKEKKVGVNLKGRSFLTLMNFNPEEIRYMLNLGHDLKAKKRAGIHNEVLKGKNVVLLFEKISTRTRCAFDVV